MAEKIEMLKYRAYPAGDTALAKGCSCSGHTNKFGEGFFVKPSGKKVFIIADTCPVHGAVNRKGDLSYPYDN